MEVVVLNKDAMESRQAHGIARTIYRPLCLEIFHARGRQLSVEYLGKETCSPSVENLDKPRTNFMPINHTYLQAAGLSRRRRLSKQLGIPLAPRDPIHSVHILMHILQDIPADSCD